MLTAAIADRRLHLPSRVPEIEEARAPSRLGRIGVDREILMRPSAGMGHVMGQATQAAPAPASKPASARPAPTPAWSASGSTTETVAPAESPRAGDSPGKDALARFKKMPDLSKPSR